MAAGKLQKECCFTSKAPRTNKLNRYIKHPLPSHIIDPNGPLNHTKPTFKGNGCAWVKGVGSGLERVPFGVGKIRLGRSPLLALQRF